MFKAGIYKSIYDPTAGTGGMLSVSEEHIKAQNPDANLGLFGQEYNPEAYAICCSDLLDLLRESRRECKFKVNNCSNQIKP